MEGREHALCLRGNTGLCRKHRGLAEDRKFLDDDLDVTIGRDQVLQRLKDTLAVAAIVVAEFIDHHRRVGIAEKRVAGIVTQDRHGLELALRRLALGKADKRVPDHLGVGEDIFLKHLVQRLFVKVADISRGRKDGCRHDEKGR